MLKPKRQCLMLHKINRLPMETSHLPIDLPLSCSEVSNCKSLNETSMQAYHREGPKPINGVLSQRKGHLVSSHADIHPSISTTDIINARREASLHVYLQLVEVTIAGSNCNVSRVEGERDVL